MKGHGMIRGLRYLANRCIRPTGLGLVLTVTMTGCDPPAPQGGALNPYADSANQAAPPAPTPAPARTDPSAQTRPPLGDPIARVEPTPVTVTPVAPVEPVATATPNPATATSTPEPTFSVPSSAGKPALAPGENAFQMALGNAEDAAAAKNKPDRDFGGSRSEFVRWNIVVDPMSADYSVPGESKLGIKIPGLTRATRTDFWESEHVRVLYPRTPSPFVGVGLNEGQNEFREVWDLRTKKQIGEIKGLGLGSTKLMALSPDGKFFAAKPRSSNLIGVYDVDAEKPVQTIPLGSPWTKFVAFAGPNRLIFDDEGHLQIWSIPDLELVNVIKLPGWIEDAATSISPGGRYVTFVDRSGFKTQATFYDLTDGSQAGQLVLSDQATCRGTSYSHDGKLFAALLDATWGGGAVQVWEVESGTLIAEHTFDDETEKAIAPRREYQGGGLSWFPEGSFLLLNGKGVYDMDAGQLVSTLPDETFYEIRALDASRIAVVQKEQLVPYDLKSQFDKAIQTREAGGTAADANRPPLVKPDRGNMSTMTMAESGMPWSAKPERFAEPRGLTNRPVDIPGGEIYVANISNLGDPQAAVMYSQSRIHHHGTWVFGHENNRVWIERFDLKSGGKKKTVDLPYPALLMAISPNGELAATVLADGLNRLDVWSLKDGLHRFGIRPYQERGNSEGRQIEFVEFLSESRLLTVAAEKLVVWEIPSGKAAYEITTGRLRPRLTPDRKYILTTDPSLHNLVVLDAATGETRGVVPLVKFAAETVHSYRVSPDGRSVAAITRRPDGGELSIIDLSSGLQTTAFPLPVTAEVIQWVRDGYLLLDGSRLVSLAQQSIVWNYDLSLGMHIREAVDDRHWYMVADSALDRSFRLVGATLPEETILDDVTSPMYKSKLLLEPGGQISLAVNVGGVPGEDQLGAKVRDGLVQKFAAARITVAPDQPLRLVINGSSGATGKELTNDIFGTGMSTTGGQVIKVQEQQVVWDIAVEHNGKRVWETSLRSTNSGSYSYNKDWDAGQVSAAASQQTADQMWRDAAGQLLEFEPPKYAFPATATLGAGKSRLTSVGPAQ